MGKDSKPKYRYLSLLSVDGKRTSGYLRMSTKTFDKIIKVVQDAKQTRKTR